MPQLTIRVDFDSGRSIGPGKIRLLEAIAAEGSIRSAAQVVGMSFRQAWLLLKAIEDMFDQEIIHTSRGGASGGGSRLTEFGELLVDRYRRLERVSNRAADLEMAPLAERIRGIPVQGSLSRDPRHNRKSLKY